MAYTVSQQNRINTATANVESTKATYDAAKATLTGLEQTARSIKDRVHQCNGYKNRTVNFERLNPDDCTPCILKRNCPDCYPIQACIDRVREFNDAYITWSNYGSTVDNTAAAYNSAQTALDNVFRAIEQESNNDPAVIAANNQLKAQQAASAVAISQASLGQSILKSKNIQIAIVGVIILVIVVGVIMVLRK